MNFNKFKNLRINFLKENCLKDHVVFEGSKSVLLSAPHGISQVRLGKNKVAEIGTIPTTIYLKNKCDCFAIIKSKNNFDDANFDQVSKYKTDIDKLVEKQKIKHLIDIHGLAANRPFDVNLGINFGKSIEVDTALFDKLVEILKTAGFVVSIDQPFSGGTNTVSGSTKTKHPNIWTIQIEINSAITNRPENIEKLNRMLDCLTRFINLIK